MLYKDNCEINNHNTSRYFGYSEDYFVHFSNDIRNALIKRYVECLINKKNKVKNIKIKDSLQPNKSLDYLDGIINREIEKKEKIKKLIK